MLCIQVRLLCYFIQGAARGGLLTPRGVDSPRIAGAKTAQTPPNDPRRTTDPLDSGGAAGGRVDEELREAEHLVAKMKGDTWSKVGTPTNKVRGLFVACTCLLLACLTFCAT